MKCLQGALEGACSRWSKATQLSSNAAVIAAAAPESNNTIGQRPGARERVRLLRSMRASSMREPARAVATLNPKRQRRPTTLLLLLMMTTCGVTHGARARPPVSPTIHRYRSQCGLARAVGGFAHAACGALELKTPIACHAAYCVCTTPSLTGPFLLIVHQRPSTPLQQDSILHILPPDGGVSCALPPPQRKAPHLRPVPPLLPPPPLPPPQ